MTGNVEQITVAGEAFTDIPKDVYIPDRPLQVTLKGFEGPLDLLLYLIKKHNIDILDIPIADITQQYLQYIELIHEVSIELAAEYLLMAAQLAEIKSRMLLPQAIDETEEEDPRAALVRRLQEYQRFQQAAQQLDELPRIGRDIHVIKKQHALVDLEIPPPELNFDEVIAVWQQVINRIAYRAGHEVKREPISLRERINDILSVLAQRTHIDFYHLFNRQEGRMGIVVSFVAILELQKQRVIVIKQSEPFSPIQLERLMLPTELEQVILN